MVNMSEFDSALGIRRPYDLNDRGNSRSLTFRTADDTAAVCWCTDCPPPPPKKIQSDFQHQYFEIVNWSENALGLQNYN